MPKGHPGEITFDDSEPGSMVEHSRGRACDREPGFIAIPGRIQGGESSPGSAPVELNPDPFRIMDGIEGRFGQSFELFVGPAADRRDIAVDPPVPDVPALFGSSYDAESRTTFQR